MNFKFLNKKIPMGFFIAGLFVIATLVYSLGYKMAMDKFNDVVSYTQEKQKMYSTLSELDYNVRSDYVGEISENDMLENLCYGYVKGLKDSSCSFFTKQDYKKYTEDLKNISPVIECRDISEEVFYLKCEKLVNNVSKDFIETLDAKISNGMSKLILDLRDSDVGNEEEVFNILKRIVPSGDIVTAVDANGKKEVVCKSGSGGMNLKIVILVNDKTSGASEILTSALKDFKNAKVIGSKTGGNAVRKKVVKLSDDSVLVFPDAYYITKSDDKSSKKSIEPDVKSDFSENEDELFQKAFDLMDNM